MVALAVAGYILTMHRFNNSSFATSTTVPNVPPLPLRIPVNFCQELVTEIESSWTANRATAISLSFNVLHCLLSLP